MRPAVLAAILLTACAARTEVLRPLQGDELLAALRGAWCNSDDGGRTCWAYDIFGSDGTLRACGRFPDEAAPFDATGAVSIAGNIMCYRVLEATPNFWVKPGTRFCTRIVAVSETNHVYQDLESGRTSTLFRVPEAAAPCASHRP